MKTLREYVVEAKIKEKKKVKLESIICWDSSHAEIRGKGTKSDSTRAASTPRRKKSLKEEKEEQTWEQEEDKVDHEDPAVAPQALESHHKGYYELRSFTDGHSSYLNSYLRHKAGDEKGTKSLKRSLGIHPDDPKVKELVDDYEADIKRISAVFNKQNTIRKSVEAYSGVPAYIGEHLQAAGEGKTHQLAGFTSTSTSRKVATKFAEIHRAMAEGSQDDPIHVLHLHMKPHTGLSVARKDHSRYTSEKEIILHHGAHITYNKTEKVTSQGQMVGSTNKKNVMYVHHVTVHPTYTPLEQYGKQQNDPEGGGR